MLTLLNNDTSLVKYIEQVKKIPMLSGEEEKYYALLKSQGNLDAAKILVSSYLKLVVKIAFKYKNYGLPMMDLISEGNIGLMKAVKDFDLEKGCKLATYAIWWVKASIQEFIIKSWSLVKIGTTAAQKKLFFNLSKIKNLILSAGSSQLSNENVKYIAENLDVRESEVLNMNYRMYSRDKSLNTLVGGDFDGKSRELMEMIPSKTASPSTVCLAKNIKKDNRKMLFDSIDKTLNQREKDIIFLRKLDEEPATLKDVAAKYNISIERVRQIEEASLKKMKDYILKNKKD